MSFSVEQIQAATRHLKKADPVMRRLIADVGPFELRLQNNAFRMLVRSIISQQISGAAAVSIRKRLEALLAPRRLTAHNLATLGLDELRTAGLSPQKAGYLVDLAQRVDSRDVRLDRLRKMSDEAAIEELVRVRGIGPWTAQMLLIFCFGRLDVFPHDDLGVRQAIKNLYGLHALPDRAASHAIAEPWRPYATVGTWYCWRSLDRDRAARTANQKPRAKGRA